MTVTIDVEFAAALLMASTAITLVLRERVRWVRSERHQRQAVRLANEGRS